MTAATTTHPFAREGLLRRAWPFLATMLLAWVLLPTVGTVHHGGLVVAAALLNVAIVLAAVFVPWQRIGHGAWLPPLAWIVVVVLLREAMGGTTSGFAPLTLLTSLWLALYGTRGEVLASGACILLAVGLPPLLTDDPGYPDTEYRRAVLMAVVSTLAGVAVHDLVTGLREERRLRLAAEAQLTRKRAFELNDDVVQDLALAKLCAQAGQTDEATAALDRALAAGKRIITTMVEESGTFQRDDSRP
jgi:hypothetical protein